MPKPLSGASGEDRVLREARGPWHVHTLGHRQFVALSQRFAELLACDDSLIEEVDEGLTSLAQLCEAHAVVGGLLRASVDAADLRGIAEYSRGPSRTPSLVIPGCAGRTASIRSRATGLARRAGRRAHAQALSHGRVASGAALYARGGPRAVS
mmetsp:Transcript_17781/g.55547  ORF Transcript_17781/g.55547 Transcript_17781/m.55547 type:complete len:153 (-) Transcript_17781:354-812(-)